MNEPLTKSVGPKYPPEQERSLRIARWLKPVINAFANPPVFADEEKTRIAGLLHTILRWVMLIAMGSFIILFFIGPSRLLGLEITLFICVIGSGLIYLTRLGKIRLASLVFVSILAIFGLTLSIFSGGLSGPSLSFNIIVILIAGLLLSGKGAIVLMSVSWITNSALALVEWKNLLPDPLAPMTIAFQWVIHSLYLIIAALLLFLANENIQSALKSARQKKEALAKEILERKGIENQLKLYAERLKLSNDELQHFARVASHDLQEPLRMVSSYLQLLDRQYQGQLDKNALDYIQFAVDGAKRMQALLADLLEYARVSTRSQPFGLVDCNLLLQNIQKNLEVSIRETGAQLKLAPLPTVNGDQHQLGQLFQNLIANALKYRQGSPPVIQIRAQEQNGHWEFSISDNGIGIDPQHHDRIFQIFQRLHTREEFPGAGIGLATCKRITDRHGGKIWVDSNLGSGSTFYFTIPQTPKAEL